MQSVKLQYRSLDRVSDEHPPRRCRATCSSQIGSESCCLYKMRRQHVTKVQRFTQYNLYYTAFLFMLFDTVLLAGKHGDVKAF